MFVNILPEWGGMKNKVVWRDIKDNIQPFQGFRKDDRQRFNLFLAGFLVMGGTARLYDGRGLYTLMVALALRGTMRPISLKMIIEKILEFEKTKTVKPDFVVILPFGSNLDEPDDGAQLKFFFQKNDEAVFDVLDLAVGGPDPKCYLGTIIKLHDIKIFLKRAFS